jgi:hypothetical protein
MVMSQMGQMRRSQAGHTFFHVRFAPKATQLLRSSGSS